MDKALPQDVERNRSDDRCTEDGEGYQEIGRRGKYHVDGDGEHGFNGKHQQLSHERYEHHSNIRRPSIFGSKQYGQTSTLNTENASWWTGPL